MKIEKSFFKPIGLLLLTTLVVHGLLLINNSVSWDSLMMKNAQDFGSYTAFKLAIFNTGRRIVYYFWVVFLKLPHPFLLIKFFTFFLLFNLSFLVYKVSSFFFEKNDSISLLLAIFSPSIPCFFMYHDPISSIYTLTANIFFLAYYLYLQVQQQNIFTKSISYLCIGFLLFWSFEIQSFYVFVYALTFALFIKQYAVAKTFLQNVITFLKRHFFIVLFPVFSFWLWNKLFPITSLAKFSGYNQISFSVKGLLYHFGFSCFKLFIMLPDLLLQLAIKNPVTTLVSGIAAYCVGKILLKNFTPTERLKIPFWLIVLLSAVFFIAAFLPYNMVGKDYGALNRNCRNGLLAGFGIVLFLVLSCNHFIKNEKLLRQSYLLLFVVFAVGSNLSYLYWQAYFVRFQKAEQLVRENLPTTHSTYLVMNEDCNNPMHQFFTFYEFNFMCKEACGVEKYLALDEHSGWAAKERIDSFITTSESYKPIFMFSNFNNKIDSPQIIHLISPANILLTNEKVVWHYWLNNCNAKDYPMLWQQEN